MSGNPGEELNRLIAIRSGLDGHQAQMLKLNLEGQGVPAFLTNDHTGSLNFMTSTDLYVRAKDWRAAEEALSVIELMPRRPGQLDSDGEEFTCRHCGSHRVHPFVGEVPTVVPFVRLKAEVNGKWFHCLECDSYFNDSRKRFAGMPIALAWSALMGALALGIIFLINWLKYL